VAAMMAAAAGMTHHNSKLVRNARLQRRFAQCERASPKRPTGVLQSAGGAISPA
jgi:hypothetical protein